MPKLIPTAEFTTGPFFPGRYVDAGANDLTRVEGRVAKGEAIELYGRVVDRTGIPMHNLIVEIWQADANGIFRHPADPRAQDADPDFFGWGRATTDAGGIYRFRTIRPGAFAMPDGKPRARHINLLVAFSGIARHLDTVVFFEGEEAANETDPVYTAVQPAALRARLVAKREASDRYRFDIRLAGEGETPFFGD